MAQFDGVSEYLLTDSNLTAGTANEIFLCVWRALGSTGTDWAISHGASSYKVVSGGSITNGSTGALLSYDTAPHIYLQVRNAQSAATLETALPNALLVDGGWYATSSWDIEAAKIYLGSSVTPSAFSNIEVAEIAVWRDAALGLGDLYGILAEMSDKYQIALETAF